MLRITDVKVQFGGLIAVNNFSMTVEQGTIHSLIGPNGAGKTTLFNSITKIGPKNSGRIFFKDEDITYLPDYKMIHRGITRTFQNLQLFNGMTIFENLYAGYVYRYQKLFPLIFLGAQRPFVQEVEDRIIEVSTKLNINRILGYYPTQLSYGVLKKVEIARAIISNPTLLLLDEPVAGLNYQETAELEKVLSELKAKGMTILLVEHDMTIVMRISDKITVMDFGKKIAEGIPSDISKDPDVIRVYLGVDEHA